MQRPLQFMTVGFNARGLALGADGNPWFCVGFIGGPATLSTIDRTTRARTDYSIPSLGTDVAFDGAGFAYVTDTANGVIYKIAIPGGGVTTFTVGGQPTAIIFGPDSRLWYCDPTSNNAKAMTTAGVVSTYTFTGTGRQLGGVSAGPDGRIWYLSVNGADNKIHVVTTTGTVTEYTYGGPSFISSIGFGVWDSAGLLWFPALETVSSTPGYVAAVNTSGAVVNNLSPTTPSTLPSLLAPDTHVWGVTTDVSGIGSWGYLDTSTLLATPFPNDYLYPTGRLFAQGLMIVDGSGDLWAMAVGDLWAPAAHATPMIGRT
jgi:streptogramin lyase